MDNVQYRPTRGRYKVYLIDEVHMLSRHSFNALLKTLEEPPEHVKFLLATTDPQKLPVTILSRCLQFNLKALSNDDISQQLNYVLGQEQVQADADALPLLARSARGSMRDALSLTDQAIAQGNGAVSIDSVRRMLGNVPVADIAALLDCVLDGEAESVMQRVDAMVSMVPDLSSVLVELQSLLHQLALVQQVPGAANAFENNDVLKPLLRRMPAELIQVFYRIVLEGRREQAYAIDARSGLEMTLLRMLCFRPAENDSYNDTSELSATAHTDVPHSNLASAEVNEPAAEAMPESVPESELEPEPAEPMPPELESQYQSEPEHQTESKHQPEPDFSYSEPTETQQQDSGVSDLLRVREQLAEKKKPDNSNESVVTPVVSEERPTAPDPEPETRQEPLAEARPVRDYQFPELNDDIREAAEIDKWSAMIAGMDISGLARQVLLNSELKKVGDDDWLILVAEEQKSLLNDSTSEAVRESLTGLLGPAARVQFDIGVPSQPTPLMVQQHIDQYRHRRACEILQADTGVQELQQRFQAQVDESSIQAR
ncbi:MAG: DNA polymerase III subunit gamma/tau [Idiomarina sp.]|nr:DNA polymerase III subunit gamma/tau [Idiomarina sp.]